MRAYISERRGPEQRIHYRMKQDIRIRMPHKSKLIWYRNTADHKLSVRPQTVHIITGSYTHNHINPFQSSLALIPIAGSNAGIGFNLNTFALCFLSMISFI